MQKFSYNGPAIRLAERINEYGIISMGFVGNARNGVAGGCCKAAAAAAAAAATIAGVGVLVRVCGLMAPLTTAGTLGVVEVVDTSNFGVNCLQTMVLEDTFTDFIPRGINYLNEMI